jgi:hypothetical protein
MARKKCKKSCLLSTKQLDEQCEKLEAQACVVDKDEHAGTIRVVDDNDDSVLLALQKGRDQPWIAMFFESDLIKWENVELPKYDQNA